MDELPKIGLWIYTAAIIAAIPATIIYAFWKQGKEKDDHDRKG